MNGASQVLFLYFSLLATCSLLGLHFVLSHHVIIGEARFFDFSRAPKDISARRPNCHCIRALQIKDNFNPLIGRASILPKNVGEMYAGAEK